MQREQPTYDGSGTTTKKATLSGTYEVSDRYSCSRHSAPKEVHYEPIVVFSTFGQHPRLGGRRTSNGCAISDNTGLSAESRVQKVHGYHRSCVNGHRNRTDGVRVRCGGHYDQDSGPGITLQFGKETAITIVMIAATATTT